MIQQELAKRLTHSFTDVNLLTQALTHRSFGAHNNERWEF
jgi:dsRNA-specific ribonuclease